MKLDEQLENIIRPVRSTTENEKMKQYIQSKLEKNKRKSSWSYGIVLVSMSILLLIFLSLTTTIAPLNNHETATPFGKMDERTKIEKVIVLENTSPQMNLNLNSIFFPLKESTTESKYFDRMVQILQTAKEKAVPWDEMIFNPYSVKDVHFKFSNDEELYVKLDSGQKMFLIDPHAKMKYELTKEESQIFTSFSEEVAESSPWSSSKKVIFVSVIILFIGSGIIIERLEKKRLAALSDSDDNAKSYTFLRGAINFIGIITLHFLSHKIGTIHLGIIGITLFVTLATEYIIKSIIKKQPILWKYEIIQWSICISFLIFLVFFI